MTITSYQQAVKYLESFIGKIIFKVDAEFLKKHDPLERMKVLLGILGNPQEKFKSVLIGGTSGKGSTAYLISHILITSGYKTGLTISPHLQKINERIQINGKEISDKKFTEIVSSLVQTIELMGKMKVGEPSYFEILIAMAFLYFVQQQVDIAVVEVGMGGEFDATNTLYPLISVLTNVGLDHTNILGKTVEKIAKTKAGIIKSGRLPHVASDARSASAENLNQTRSLSERRLLTDRQSSFSSLASGQAPIVITGVKQPSVIKIVEDKCREVGAKLYRLGKDFKLTNLKLSLLGEYQKENASLAVQAVARLREFGFKISEENIKKALSTAFFPGRFEIIKKSPNNPITQHPNIQIVLDGAHNPTKMRAFLSTLKKLYPNDRKIFLIAFKKDKDIPKMLKQILKVADEIIVTEFHRTTDMSVSASASVESIKYQVLSSKYSGKVIVEKDSKKALDLALNYPITQYPNNPSLIVVTGSLYLVGEIRSML